MQILGKVRLDNPVSDIGRNLRQIGRKIAGVEKAIIEDYFSGHKTAKLHIGCGANKLDGWLNSDLFPNRDGVIHLDATDIFPFPDAKFDYIFSEHMIEHIPYANGLSMLNECLRVLKPGGKIRISTPDLRFLIDLYTGIKSDLQKKYIQWSTDNFIEGAPYYDDIFVINNFVRDWGHVFIYDEKTLRRAMESAGFVGVKKCALNISAETALANLENEKRMPDGFLSLESMTLEATRPG